MANQKTLLLIDDDLLNSTLLTTTLENAGYRVETAGDGTQGLEKLKKINHGIDLVLLDLLMPGMDGFEVLAGMESTGILHRVPVIVMSAETDPDGIGRCLEMGAIDYLTKPYDAVLFQARINNVLLSAGHHCELRQAATGKILIVDDDPIYRMILKTTLEENEFTVVDAESGRSALELLQQDAYDLIFVDLMMPEMDGFEFIEHVKADTRLRHIPVIVISGENDMEDIIRCIEIGASDYICKPYEPATLNARVNISLNTGKYGHKQAGSQG